MYQSETAPWLEFFAWNTDGSAKTDLVYNTSGISIVVVRDNLANSSALTLSAASGPTDWAAGKFHAMGGNKYRVGIATASISSFTGKISVEGSYTGGVITGVTEYVTAYNPTGNPNTTTPPTAAANASAVRTELATELARVDAAISTRSTFAGGAVASVTGNVGGNVVGSVASVVGAVELDSAARATLVDEIWDEQLTGATHNVATSAGRRLRQINAFQQIDGAINDAAATPTMFITDLASSVDDFYNDSMLVFTSGALAGQVRSIVDYAGSTKTITIEEALTSAPVNGVEFTIVSLHIHPVSQIQSGLATAASITTLRGADNDTLKTLSDQIDGIGGGGGGSGDATLANQTLILTQLDVIQDKTDLIGGASGITSLLAAAVLEPGTITAFPEVLTVGDSYTLQNGRAIYLPVVDTDGNPISSTGQLDFASASVTFTIQRFGETNPDRVITGSASFVDPPGTGTGAGAPYAIIELPASETSKGLVKYKYSGILTFTWTGTGTDVMSFETGTITFDN